MSADEHGQDPILDAIAASVDGMVVAYVVVANYLDADGDSRILTDSFENQRIHQSLGLLAFATAIEQARAASEFDGDG